MAAIGAEGVLGDLGVQPGAAQAGESGLNKFIVIVEDPTGEEPFATNLFACVALLYACGEAHFRIELRVAAPLLANQVQQRLQNRLFGFADQQAAVVGGAAIVGHDRRTRIGRRLDVGEFENSLAENWVHRRFEFSDFANELRHFVDGVDAGARIGGVGRLAEGFHHDLGAAALPAFEIELRGFADDNVVRVDALADFSGGDALEAFLVNDPGDNNLTGKISLHVLGEERGSRHHCSDGAFHVGGAAAVDLSVCDLAAEGLVRPAGWVGHRDGVDVAVEEEHFARAVALNAAQNVAVRIDEHVVVGQFMKGLLHARDDAVLVPRIALCLDERLAQVNHLLAPTCCQHALITPSEADPRRL